MADPTAIVEPTTTQTSVAVATTSPSAAQIADILRQARLQIKAVDVRAMPRSHWSGSAAASLGAAHTPAAFWAESARLR